MALINGGEMREKLQELLEKTAKEDGDRKSGEGESEGVDGKLSYTGSFRGSN